MNEFTFGVDLPLPGWLEMHCVAAFRMLLATACGALVGIERERHDKGAGLRTHILLALGACIFAMIGLRLDTPEDMMRLVQALAVGVGFLCGGVIFTRKSSVHGMTTAVGLWVMTAVGLAIGVGYHVWGVMGTVLTFAIVAGLKRVEPRLHERYGTQAPPEGPSED